MQNLVEFQSSALHTRLSWGQNGMGRVAAPCQSCHRSDILFYRLCDLRHLIAKRYGALTTLPGFD
jgi:hypothetical protein